LSVADGSPGATRRKGFTYWGLLRPKSTTITPKVKCCCGACYAMRDCRCEGQTNCSLDVNDATFGGTDPCPHTGKYLEVIYLCVPGKTPSSTCRCFSGHFPTECSAALPNCPDSSVLLRKCSTNVSITVAKCVAGDVSWS